MCPILLQSSITRFPWGISMSWGTTTRTTRTPAFWGYPPPPHDYPYYWVILDPKSKEDKVKVTNTKNLHKLQILRFWSKLYMPHTSWCCLIRCVNMKWIWRELLKIQSGHDSVHRRTDGQGETSIPTFQLRWSEGYNDSVAINIGFTHDLKPTIGPPLFQMQKPVMGWLQKVFLRKMILL